jgi:glycosyltransferase involved in cell wall biosynthesis
MKPTRILIVAPSLEIIGGQTIQASRLLSHLGREPSLLVHQLATNTPLPGFLRWIRKVKYLRTAVNFPLYGLRVFHAVCRYDIIHIFSAHHTSFLIAPAPALLAARLFGKSSILNYRSGFAEEHLRRYGRSAIPIMRLAREVVVPSGFLVEVFGRFGLKARSIHNFVNTDQFSYRVRDPLQPCFMANRALESSYNVACILKAFGLIQKRFPWATLSVAGDGPERGALEKLSESLGLRNVSFLGWVPPQEIAGLYNKAHIYLNAPDADNMPSAVIEAFASGTAVVSTNAGGIPHIVADGETGMLVDCNDHEAMAAKAVRLLENGDLARRIIAAAREQCLKYEWRAVREEWLGLYRELMNSERRREGE